MAKRIFTSFAVEDRNEKVMFTGQAKNTSAPYEFVDMSVKNPWDNSWKTKCRTRIKGCDGVIVLITSNLKCADGALWEIKCATEEYIPILGVYMKGASILDSPDALQGVAKVDWTWDNIKTFIESV